MSAMTTRGVLVARGNGGKRPRPPKQGQSSKKSRRTLRHQNIRAWKMEGVNVDE